MFRKSLLKIFLLIQIFALQTYAQQSLDIYGGFSKLMHPKYRLNSFEGNTMNFNRTIDWEFGFSGAVILSKKRANSIQLASVGKRIGDHYLYARYTPGFKKSFALNTDTLVTIDDSINVLNSSLNYSELFGAGYSYQFSNSFTAGVTLRYFEQSYSQENVYFYFSDTVNTLVTNLDYWNKKQWRGDIGFTYQPYSNLLFSVSSSNLLILNESGGFVDNTNLELKTTKDAIIGIEYNPFNNIFLFGNYETSSSFLVGANYSINLLGGKLGLGMSMFHDKYQTPYITGVQPAINFSSKILSVSVSAIYYTHKRSKVMEIGNLLTDGIHSITNNQFSYSKIVVSINLSLNFKRKQNIKFLDVEIENQIFPILSEEYIGNPFAYGKIINLSENSIVVKPSSYVSNINNDVINSPSVTVAPMDTALIPFYTVISRDLEKFGNREIGQAHFYITSIYDENDDELQKPILINGLNSWNSEVKNLRYFVRYNFSESHKYSKNILNNKKLQLKNVDERLLSFKQIEILFDSFVKQMQYVADPRSSTEYVQFPTETLKIKGGDCDDLSVAFGSMLESIGIETAFVDYKSDDKISHVNLLVNTKLKPSEAQLITTNDKKYFVRKSNVGIEEIWIPIEMTSLTNFNNAWEVGAEKFNNEAIEGLGLVKGNVAIYNVY